MFKTVTIAAIAGLAASPAFAQFADFDTETEGPLGISFNSGGINFVEANNVNGFYPDGTPFTPTDLGTDYILERSGLVWNDYPDFVSFPNTLTFGKAFVPGDNVTFGPLAIASMSAAGTFTQGGLDIIYLENGPWGGIEVTLEALSRGSVVGSDSFTVSDGGGRDNPAALHLSVAAPSFDTMRISATLNGEFTTVRALLDNVSFVPAPGVLSVGGLGLLGACRRRR